MVKSNKKYKAQTVTLGYIFVLLIITMTIGLWETNIAPGINKGEEISEHKDLKNDFLRLEGAIFRSIMMKTSQPVNIGGKIDYIHQFSHIPSSTVQINSESLGQIKIEAYKNSKGSKITLYSKSLDNNIIKVTRDYNYYQTPSILKYENSISYTKQNNSTYKNIMSKQNIVNNNSISLISIQNIQEISKPIDIQNTVTLEKNTTKTIKPDNNGVTISFKTKLSQQKWEKLLKNELSKNDGNIKNISKNKSTNVLKINLKGNQTYTVRIYKLNITSIS